MESQFHLFATFFESPQNLVVLSTFALLVYNSVFLFECLFSFKLCSYFPIPIYGFLNAVCDRDGRICVHLATLSLAAFCKS